MEKEEWESLPGYDGIYVISNLGRIKSCMRYARSGAGMRRVPERIMTQTVHPQTGHCRVQVSKRGKTKTLVVYKMVMEAFGDSGPQDHEIRHIDGNRQNNSFGNLAWVPIESPNSGELHANATLNNVDVEEIRKLREGGMAVEQIADKMQISKAQVSKIASGNSR